VHPCGHPAPPARPACKYRSPSKARASPRQHHHPGRIKAPSKPCEPTPANSRSARHAKLCSTGLHIRSSSRQHCKQEANHNPKHSPSSSSSDQLPKPNYQSRISPKGRKLLQARQGVSVPYSNKVLQGGQIVRPDTRQTTGAAHMYMHCRKSMDAGIGSCDPAVACRAIVMIVARRLSAGAPTTGALLPRPQACCCNVQPAKSDAR
jgi:hypothetical protein